MPSSPPRTGLAEKPPRLLGAPTGEDVLYAAIEQASPQACRTYADGRSLVFLTEVRGRVLSTDADGLWLDHDGRRCRARLLLPAALDAGSLVGRTIRVAAAHAYAGERVTVDARIHDAEERLLLWARDGALPADQDAPFAVRIAVYGDRSKLVLAQGSSMAAPRSSGWSEIDLDTRFHVWVGRIEPDDLALLVVRS